MLAFRVDDGWSSKRAWDGRMAQAATSLLLLLSLLLPPLLLALTTAVATTVAASHPTSTVATHCRWFHSRLPPMLLPRLLTPLNWCCLHCLVCPQTVILSGACQRH